MILDIDPAALHRWVELPAIGEETPEWRASLADALSASWEDDWSDRRDAVLDAIDHGLGKRSDEVLATLQLWPHDGPANATLHVSMHRRPDDLAAEVAPEPGARIDRLHDARLGPGYEVLLTTPLRDGVSGLAARYVFADERIVVVATLDETHPVFASAIIGAVRALVRGIVVAGDDGRSWRSEDVLGGVASDPTMEPWPFVGRVPGSSIS